MAVGSAEKHGLLTAEGSLFRSTGGNMIDSQLVICLILFVLACIGYVTNMEPGHHGAGFFGGPVFGGLSAPR